MVDKTIQPKYKSAVILMAEDDPDDRFLAREAMKEARLTNELYFVEDGVELIQYLRREGQYFDPKDSPRPDLILLDLNMPRMDGREVLEILKDDDDLRILPVVILTTSQAEEDILRSYDLGVSGYITKPVRFEALIDVMKTLGRYWFQIVALPPD